MPRERALHLYLEASRLAYADRGAFVADPGYVSVPLAQLLSDQFAAQRRAKIAETRGDDARWPAGDPERRDRHQRVDHARRLDDQPDGERPLGQRRRLHVHHRADRRQRHGRARLRLPAQQRAHRLQPDHRAPTRPIPGGVSTGANKVEGGKRPRSSIAPTIVLRNGRPFLALGSPGGASIITTVAQILVNRLDFGMTLPDAVAAPRLSQRNTRDDADRGGVPERRPRPPRCRPAGRAFTVTTGTRRGDRRRDRDRVPARRQVLVAAEPVRRGGGSAAVVSSGGHRPHGGDGHGGRHRMRAPHDVKRPARAASSSVRPLLRRACARRAPRARGARRGPCPA